MIDIDGTLQVFTNYLYPKWQRCSVHECYNGIYPNPTSHLINIDYQSVAISKVEIKILNVVGQEMSVTEMNTL